MHEKIAALIAIQGDPLGIVTDMLVFARDNKVFTEDVIVHNLDVPSGGGICLLSVQGDAREHVANKLKQMVASRVLPKRVRVVHVSVCDDHPEKIDPNTPGFSPTVSWGFGIQRAQ